MDIEIYKMLLTIISQLIDKLPIGLTGTFVTILIIYIFHKNKNIPFKIVRVGVNGNTNITSDMLKMNCKNFHIPLDESLKIQQKTLDIVVNNQNKIADQVVAISKSVSFIEGKLSK